MSKRWRGGENGDKRGSRSKEKGSMGEDRSRRGKTYGIGQGGGGERREY